jgi:hypothetical protein
MDIALMGGIEGGSRQNEGEGSHQLGKLTDYGDVRQLISM